MSGRRVIVPSLYKRCLCPLCHNRYRRWRIHGVLIYNNFILLFLIDTAWQQMSALIAAVRRKTTTKMRVPSFGENATTRFTIVACQTGSLRIPVVHCVRKIGSCSVLVGELED